MIQNLRYGVHKQLPELSMHSSVIQNAVGAGALQAMHGLAGRHEVIQAVAQDVQQRLAGCIEHLQPAQPLSFLVAKYCASLIDPVKSIHRLTCTDHRGPCHGKVFSAAHGALYRHLYCADMYPKDIKSMMSLCHPGNSICTVGYIWHVVVG